MKTRKNKKGISLIVLVITIIVMVILAAAIIISISNSGIVNRANEAVEKSDEAQIKQLVSLAWSEAYFKDTTETKDDAYYLKEVKAYLLANGMTEDELTEYDITANKNGASATLKNDLGGNRSVSGFYFDELYTATYSEGSIKKTGYVFHKDGSAEYYIFYINGDEEVSVRQNAFPSGSIIYEENQIAFDTTVYNVSISADGYTVVLGPGTENEVTFNCEPGVLHGIYYNRYYRFISTDNLSVATAIVDGEDNLTIKVVQDGETTLEYTKKVVYDGHGHGLLDEEGNGLAVLSADGKYLTIVGPNESLMPAKLMAETWTEDEVVEYTD